MTNRPCKFVSVAEKINHINFATCMRSLYALETAQVLGFTVANGDTYCTVSGTKHLKVDKGMLLKHGPLSELDQILIKEAIKFYASLFA